MYNTTRNRKIIIFVLCAFFVMSTGYALFTDKLNIKGVASLKGEADYNIEVYKGVSPEINDSTLIAYKNFENAWRNSDKNKVNDYLLKPDSIFKISGTSLYSEIGNIPNINDSTIQLNQNKITTTINFNYLTQEQNFTIKLTNTGNIPLTIDFWGNGEAYYSPDKLFEGIINKEEYELKNNQILNKAPFKAPNYPQDGHMHWFDSCKEDWDKTLYNLKKYKLTFIMSKKRWNEFENSLLRKPQSNFKIDKNESVYLILNSSFNFPDEVGSSYDTTPTGSKKCLEGYNIKGISISSTVSANLPVKVYQ